MVHSLDAFFFSQSLSACLCLSVASLSFAVFQQVMLTQRFFFFILIQLQNIIMFDLAAGNPLFIYSNVSVASPAYTLSINHYILLFLLLSHADVWAFTLC